MSKRLILVLTLAFVFGIAFAAYAEVQNIKVSGDLLFTTASRQMFGLGGTTSVSGDKKSDTENLLITQARLMVDADLTDNVAATLRLINERSWNSETSTSTNIDVDLAYVALKEFLYSPLSVTVGRQEIKLGNGLIIGNARTYATAKLNGVPSDLSLRKSFDAITAVLDYDPLVITGLYAKIDGSTRTLSSGVRSVRGDTDLWGVNAAYDLGRRGAKAEAYYLRKNGDASGFGDTTTVKKEDVINVFGALLSATPIENLKTSAELAFQYGEVSGGTPSKKRAMAAQVMADYTFAKVKYTPALGVSYTYLSGDKDTTDNKDKSWDRMYYDQALNNITYAILPFSNMDVVNLKGSVKPKEDITIAANLGIYRVAHKISSLTGVNVDSNGNTYGNGSSNDYTMDSTKKDLGTALDLTASYDYTEDVQIALTGGMFKAGKAFAASNRSTATQVLGTMKVTF